MEPTIIRERKLIKRQNGFCPWCKTRFLHDAIAEVDHIIPRNQGGKDEYKKESLPFVYFQIDAQNQLEKKDIFLHSKLIKTVASNFYWTDLGSFDAIVNYFEEGNQVDNLQSLPSTSFQTKVMILE